MSCAKGSKFDMSHLRNYIDWGSLKQGTEEEMTGEWRNYVKNQARVSSNIGQYMKCPQPTALRATNHLGDLRLYVRVK